MSMSTSPQITDLLADWSNGDREALDKLILLVYDELHRLASYYLRQERPDHTLQTTALVNEAYVRMVGYRDTPCQGRAHFFAIAAQAMRRILVEHARSSHRKKRGGNPVKIQLDDKITISSERSRDLLALDEALTSLEALHPRKCKVVEMRFFAGMSVEETAEALNVSKNTVVRDWNFAEAWLRREVASLMALA